MQFTLFLYTFIINNIKYYMKLNFPINDFLKFKKFLNIKDFSNDIEKKLIGKTIQYIKFIKWIPGLQMIAIWNSVALNSANQNSDIDLFIVSKPNRLWIVRIFTTIIFQILFVRKNKNKHKWRFCLSFFCTTKVLNFETIAIENDIYLYFWMVYLKPILDYDNTYDLFINENKNWCDFNSYINIIKENRKHIIYKKNTSKYNYKLINLIEALLKYIFLPKTKKSFKKLWPSFWIIISDDMLKFHNDDKRKIIRDIIL